jgi:Glycosyltransferase like family
MEGPIWSSRCVVDAMLPLPPAVIAFGSATTNEREYRAYAAPTVERLAEADSLLMRRHGCDSIHQPYNEMLAEAAEHDDLEAVVLLHQDVSIEDDLFLPRVRALLAASDDVAVIGSAGARNVSGLAWWEGSPRGRAQSPVLVPGGSIDVYSRGNFEVESVDGMLLVLSAWAARELRFDRSLSGALDGYDADICLQARARGRRVVVGDFRVSHYTQRQGFLNHGRWVQADVALRRKWSLGVSDPVPAHL